MIKLRSMVPVSIGALVLKNRLNAHDYLINAQDGVMIHEFDQSKTRIRSGLGEGHDSRVGSG